jgi:hypothetical protein
MFHFYPGNLQTTQLTASDAYLRNNRDCHMPHHTPTPGSSTESVVDYYCMLPLPSMYGIWTHPSLLSETTPEPGIYSLFFPTVQLLRAMICQPESSCCPIARCMHLGLALGMQILADLFVGPQTTASASLASASLCGTSSPRLLALQ